MINGRFGAPRSLRTSLMKCTMFSVYAAENSPLIMSFHP